MNWIDLLVLIIILGFAIGGLMHGFIFSLFRIASFFLSIIISIKFYPVVANILMKTVLYTHINASILKNLLRQQVQKTPTVGAEAKKVAADAVINNLQLPGFLKGTLIDKLPNPTQLIDVQTLMERISSELAKVVIGIISLVLLYILIRITLIFVRFILQGIAKLPIFKQMDKLGGFAFGAVEGLLTIYVICAVVMMFKAMPQYKSISDAVDKSVIANYFYQHNFIIEFMFPQK